MIVIEDQVARSVGCAGDGTPGPAICQSLLDGGVERLAGANWVIVPEPNFGHPTLKRLGFVERFHADTTFAGSVGYDYDDLRHTRHPGRDRPRS